MIKIQKTPSELKTLAEEHYKILCDKFAIRETLDKQIEETSGNPKTYFELLKEKLVEIITAEPIRLEDLGKELGTAYENADGKKRKDRKEKGNDTKKRTLDVFCYDAFIRDQGPDKTNYAYALAQKLNVPVCPYCNRQHTTTIRTKTKRTRPQFDHFLNKGTYPYFALSFYNLIPSCSTCNSDLKGTEPFLPSTHLHPYLEDADDTYSFQTGITARDYVEGNQKDFSIEIKQRSSNKNENKFERAFRNVEAFGLIPLYQEHKAYAADIIRIAFVYNQTMKDEIKNALKGITDVEIRELILGNYIRTEYLGLRPLAKLTKDLAEELQMHQ